ncbi:hypothetical protein DXV75_09460 [Alteromonas aestuariivivens]|uniref:Lipoprotein n=1 Tax=Alteromonas aestuariivivens TaxID=1938339 RepID=A0A3D8M730_9ALTE|nr:hypothetical protein [Alteromonas aestuariivivens]RDV25515.1 hypothetical protein DXV75_09460 [Alteromonas aestuariivivens]
MKSPFRTSTLCKLVIVLGAAVALSACRITPHADVGLDVNYYNGGFHVNPNAHVGLSGRPDRH